MKELSIKEKVKAYDEAIERAKKWRNAPNIDKMPTYGSRIIEEIFPELRENEDEKIRKWLIGLVEEVRKENPTNAEHNGMCSEAIAWLEKQGEQVDVPKWKYKSDNAPLLGDSIILNKYGCVAKSPSGALVSDVWVMNYADLAKLPKEGEKQGEQKETLCDKCKKAQPSHSCQDITELGRCAVEHEQKPVIEGTFVNVDEVREEFMQEVYRVLDADPNNDRANQIIDTFDRLPTVELEKKEWKEIEKESEISFGAYDSELQEDMYFIPKGFHAEIDDDKVVIKNGEKPTAWSEEDEYNLQCMIAKVTSDIQKGNVGRNNELID